MQPTGEQLELHVNGWLQDLFGGAQPESLPRRTRGAAHSVTVPSKLLEDDEEHLDEAASGVTRVTMGALQKQMRSAGFKGALVSGYGVGAGRSGFVVKYQGKDYYFSIDEDPHRGHTVESRQARRLVPHGDNMQSNTSRYRLARIKTCANCGHHKSMHRYEGQDLHSPPKTCTVGGCTCRLFRQPEVGERIQRRNGHEPNARGVYHGTGVAKNDMVLHQGPSGRWRIDLVTSAGGNHTDVTGRSPSPGSRPNSGYDSAEQAFQAALDEQRTRGIRGKSHVWVQAGDELTDYVPEEARSGASRRELEHLETILRRHGYDPADASKLQAEGMGPTELEGRIVHHPGDLERTHGFKRLTRNGNLEPNGRRTGILSDGTRVNVYYEKGSGEPWTVVPHGEDWDAQERRGMRQMLGMSESGIGISQWGEGQEGRHLGRSVPWDAVPDHIKRHIEQRVAQETMVANPRKRTTKKSAPATETREQRIVREWEKAEDAGLVRIQADPEYENYFDVYGEPDSPEERAEQEELIERHGVYRVYSQYKSQDSGDWETADAVGMIFGNDLGDDNPYVLDMKQSALQNVFGGHTPNARGSVANEHSVRELSLYIENEYSLVGAPNSRGKAIHENLLRKVKSGKYDKALAPKAWQYLIDEGAKKYTKEFGGGGAQIFTVADRRQVAEEYARAWEEENLR